MGAKWPKEIFRTGIDNILTLFVEVAVNRAELKEHGVHGREECGPRILEPKVMGEVAVT